MRAIPYVYQGRKYLLITMRCGGDKIWYQCKSEAKFMDYFTKSQTFSAQQSFTYAGNKLYLHKKRKLLPCIEKLISTGSHCLATFCWSINCITWMSLNRKKHISDMSRSLSVICIWDLLTRFHLRKVQC